MSACRARALASVHAAVAVTLGATPIAGAQASGECAPDTPASAAHAGRLAAFLSRCIVGDALWPRAGGSPWLGLGPATTAPTDSAAFAAVFSYVSRPLVLTVPSADYAGTRTYVLDNVLGATFAVALGLGPRVELTVAAPFVLFQDGAGLSAATGGDHALPPSAVGDVRFGTGVALVPRRAAAPPLEVEDGEHARPAPPDGPALGARLEVVAPTGSGTAFASAGSATLAPSLLYDQRLGIVRWGAELGARLRPVAQELAGSTVQNQLATAAGVSVDALEEGWLSVSLELSALVGLVERQRLVPDPATGAHGYEPTGSIDVPAEWLLGVRTAHWLDGRLGLAAAGGGFVPTGEVSALGTPRFRFALALEYASPE
ncbi:MAG: hypothetical protein HY908_10060 [Myxococcales bacterium]|nr:hypothetical protein [Myxococcales bacterium]